MRSLTPKKTLDTRAASLYAEAVMKKPASKTQQHKAPAQMSFRPDAEVRQLVALAAEATGATQEQIISECIRRGVSGVVDAILSTKGEHLEAFRKAVRETGNG